MNERKDFEDWANEKTSLNITRLDGIDNESYQFTNSDWAWMGWEARAYLASLEESARSSLASVMGEARVACLTNSFSQITDLRIERDGFRREACIAWLFASAGWLVVALILFIR